MTPPDFLKTILDPGLAWCSTIPGWTIPSDDRARVLLLAIAGQEGGWEFRVQGCNGPAHGFWEFERGGGVAGVLTNAVTYKMAMAACAKAKVPPNPSVVWRVMAIPTGDALATAFARLLVWSDPAPLPPVTSSSEGWDYYLRNWRPGSPGPDRWQAIWEQARDAVLLTATA